jgi:hypothetical protein
MDADLHKSHSMLCEEGMWYTDERNISIRDGETK